MYLLKNNFSRGCSLRKTFKVSSNNVFSGHALCKQWSTPTLQRTFENNKQITNFSTFQAQKHLFHRKTLNFLSNHSKNFNQTTKFSTEVTTSELQEANQFFLNFSKEKDTPLYTQVLSEFKQSSTSQTKEEEELKNYKVLEYLCINLFFGKETPELYYKQDLNQANNFVMLAVKKGYSFGYFFQGLYYLFGLESYIIDTSKGFDYIFQSAYDSDQVKGLFIENIIKRKENEKGYQIAQETLAYAYFYRHILLEQSNINHAFQNQELFQLLEQFYKSHELLELPLDELTENNNSGELLVIAMKWMFKAVNHSTSSLSSLIIGVSFLHGINGFPVDKEQALKYIKQSADNNFIPAHYYYSYCLTLGYGIEKNKEKAMEHLEIAANAGYCEAQFKLGEYYDMIGEKEKGRTYLLMGAANGSSSACVYLGKELVKSTDKVTIQAGIQWLEKAANNNSGEAQYELSYWHEFGIEDVITLDLQTAFYYLYQSAENGFSRAMNKLMCLHIAAEEYDKAKHWLDIAFEMHPTDPETIFNIAQFYRAPSVEYYDLTKSISFFELAASYDLSAAQYELALIYLKSDEIQKDFQKGIYYLSLACDNDHLQALHLMAQCYYHSIYDVPYDPMKSFNYFLKAAELGNIESQEQLASLYLLGIPQEVLNIEEGKKWLIRAATAGNPIAQFRLANAYLQDQYSFGLNVEEAMKWLELSGKGGYHQAQFTRAYLLLYGEHEANKDPVLAFNLLKELTENHPDYGLGFYQLGICYEEGLGTEIDYKKAIDAYKESVDQVIYSKIRIGDIYATGFNDSEEGVSSYKLAFDYYCMAAQQNDPYAYMRLGDCFERGIWVKKDGKKALSNYKMADKLGGHPTAKYTIAALLLSGSTNLKRDIKKGISYLIDAATKDNNEFAQVELATYYFFGECGLERDFPAAVYYFHLASEKNNLDALYFLGIIHMNGMGLKKDTEKGIEYLCKASERGCPQSLQYLLFFVNNSNKTA